ncbi:MAG: phosphoglycerate kinase, partial [Clostridia bacterium]|nr:phosphoglycerate kinase [Clostridia bacterium]
MTYNKKTVEDIDVAGKKVLVRCDFNVPVKDGVITDDKRIVGAMKTIEYLISKDAKVILCSHMGRPHNVLDAELKLDKKEKKKIEALPAEEQEAAKAAALEKGAKDITKLSLKIIADDLTARGLKVTLAKDVVGPDAQAKAAALQNGEILLLENVRFHAAEE